MGVPGASGRLIREGLGVESASAAQVGPPVLGRNDVGVEDMILGDGQERTSWASSARDSCDI